MRRPDQVFFPLAGGRAAALMAGEPKVLQAISSGAVFFGYHGLACVLLLPLFALVTVLCFV
jgi:hypothetical protein